MESSGASTSASRKEDQHTFGSAAQSHLQQKEPQLSVEDIAKCKRAARNEGVFAGLTSGFLGGIMGSRAFRLNRNQTLLCGLLTGVLSGYYFTQAFLSSRLAEMTKQQALLRGNLTLTESEFDTERLHEVPSPRQ